MNNTDIHTHRGIYYINVARFYMHPYILNTVGCGADGVMWIVLLILAYIMIQQSNIFCILQYWYSRFFPISIEEESWVTISSGDQQLKQSSVLIRLYRICYTLYKAITLAELYKRRSWRNIFKLIIYGGGINVIQLL